MTTLLIEGWRGVNHSFATVNQCQILELLKFPDLRLFHRDLPFAMPHWNRKSLDAGFSPDDDARIQALAEPGDAEVDAIYRIASPFRVDATERRPVLTFMVTELGLSASSFEPGRSEPALFTHGLNAIVTPTRWSRERLVEHGFDPQAVHVVPHGVRSDTYFPLQPEERALNRRNLGFEPDEPVFLNLGAPMWNKGLDVLLLAFARLRQRQPRARLLLKDQRGLYGLSVEQTVKDLAAVHPGLFDAACLGAIRVMQGNLSQAQLRLMYGVADCYVSPYRAEGFNLPVLEAIACGTPAVVTDGGATDDFCTPGVAWRIPSQAGTLDAAVRSAVGRYREPDGEALLELLTRFCDGGRPDPATFESARQALVADFTWQRAAQSLHALVQDAVALSS